MDFLSCAHWSSASRFLDSHGNLHGNRSSPKLPKLWRALASKNQTKMARTQGKMRKGGNNFLQKDQITEQDDLLNGKNSKVEDENGSEMLSSNSLDVENSVVVPSRSAVLQACTVTSGFIGFLGVLIRQVSHVASEQGWPVPDCSADITCNRVHLSVIFIIRLLFSVFTNLFKTGDPIFCPVSFEPWHIELVAGSVILISSCRFLLLKVWPEFAESSQAANQQVLTSLEPLDYLAVAFIPGITEELLFRGALLPLLGINFMSISAVAALFGVLHLGSGRKYSFVIWATFVGFVYGYITVLSSSIVVPMASHALNNLVGGIIWRYSLKGSQKIE